MPYCMFLRMILWLSPEVLISGDDVLLGKIIDKIERV